MVNETSKNVQNILAVQSLQSRITKLERSCSSLRELLKQRMGEGGVLELINALDVVGAGGLALMETPLVDGDGDASTPRDSAHSSDNRDGSQQQQQSKYGRQRSDPTSKFGREIDSALYR